MDEATLRRIVSEVVRDEVKSVRDVLAQMNLRLVKNHPSARTATTTLERRTQLFTNRGSSYGVKYGRARALVERSENDLGDHVLG